MDDIQAGAGLAPDSVDDVPTSDGGQVIADRVRVPTPFIAIATPSIDAHCTMAHRSSMIELRGLLITKGVPHAIFDRSRMLYLDRVRDYLCTQFYEDFPDATDLFLIDADVGFPAEKVLEFAIRPEPLLLGAPPKKEDKAEGPSFTVRFLADTSSGEPRLIQNNGLVKIDRGPAGFIRIKRSVLQTMIEADKCVRYREPETGRMLWHFFSCGVGPDADSDVEGQLTYWGEDTVFIQRAINCGIECWCDPNIHFAHTGLKTWQGNLYRELLRQHGKMVEPEGLAPSHVGASSPVPAHNEAAAMDDYPKWVHGKLAASAEEESALEREFLAANPGWEPPAPDPVDAGIAPVGVSASTPIVPDDQKSTAQLEAEIEAALEIAAELTVQVAAPAEIPAAQAFEPVKEDLPAPVEAANLPAEQEPVTTAENTPAEPVDETAPISGTVAQPVEQPVEEDPPVPVAGLEAPPIPVDQTAEVDTGANLAGSLAETPQTAAPVAAVDTAPAAAVEPSPQVEVSTSADLEVAAQQSEAPAAIAAVESGNLDSAPAAEPAAAVDEAVAPASESPGSGEPSPAADQVEAAAPVEQVQAAAETPIAAVDVGAAAAPVDAPEPVLATAPAAEVDQPAADAPLAAAEASPTVDQPLSQPPSPLSVAQEETAAAGDAAQPAPPAAATPADPLAQETAATVEPSETAAQSDGAAPADQAPQTGSAAAAPDQAEPAAAEQPPADGTAPDAGAEPAAEVAPQPDAAAAPAQGGAV